MEKEAVEKGMLVDIPGWNDLCEITGLDPDAGGFWGIMRRTWDKMSADSPYRVTNCMSDTVELEGSLLLWPYEALIPAGTKNPVTAPDPGSLMNWLLGGE